MTVIEFTGKTALDIPSDRVLQAALDAKITDAVVMGYDPDGSFYVAASVADGGDMLWLLELAKQSLMRNATI